LATIISELGLMSDIKQREIEKAQEKSKLLLSGIAT
jgi:hypothetical protein